MEILGIIRQVLEVKSGSSPKGDYYVQPIVVELEESFNRVDGSQGVTRHSLLVDITGRQARNFSLGVGTKVRMNVFFHCKEWNGKWFQGVSCGMIYVV